MIDICELTATEVRLRVGYELIVRILWHVSLLTLNCGWETELREVFDRLDLAADARYNVRHMGVIHDVSRIE
jgi:hypothetical protein